MAVTLAACRRCDRARRPSRAADGQLICGHCGEPMPILEEGTPLPVEKDCTPVPVQFRIDGDLLVVRAADIEAGRPLFAKNQGLRISPEFSSSKKLSTEARNGVFHRISTVEKPSRKFRLTGSPV